METLTRDDCLCPVCLEIFMEPVTLPCSHTFCKACFLESVDKATLCCPLCRKRVSTWARLNNRTNSLVNQQLWQQIQSCFPLQCQRRLSGQDAMDDDCPVSVCLHRLSKPGELRQEYEDQITQLTEEKRVLEEQQRRASEELIQKMLEEEELLLQEEARKRQEDERLARLLSDQLNSPPVPQQNLRPGEVTPAQKKKEVGQIERFLCPRAPPICSFQSNKENILVSEAEQQAQHPVPHLDDYGPQTELHPPQEEDHLLALGGPSSAKRKNSELDTTEEVENDITKRRRHPSSLEVGLVLQGAAEREAELQVRWRQEEEDRRLALLLQKELDKEERQKAIDRRKGSANAHLLRQRRETREEAAGRSGTKTLKRVEASGRSGTKILKSFEAAGCSGTKTLNRDEAAAASSGTKTLNRDEAAAASSGTKTLNRDEAAGCSGTKTLNRDEAAGSSGTKTLKTSSSSSTVSRWEESAGSSSASWKTLTSSCRGRKQTTLTEMFSSLSS